MRWVESHCSQVLRCCHPERSSCSGEFDCRSFKKHLPCTVCFLPCHMKKLACLYELKFFFIVCFLFSWSPLQDSVLETSKLQAKVLNSTCRTILVCKLSQIVNFDGLTLLTAFVLYGQSDYLNHSNRDSDWLIGACFMRVWSTLTTLLLALEIKFVSKIESNSWGI